MSQVVTLYKDKEKTDALYPRTKVSAISDDNNTSLQELLNRYEVIDNLTSYETDKALSANQGRELNDTFKNYYNKTEVNDLLDNIDITGMVKQEEGGTVEEIVTPTNADTLGGKLTANNVVFYEEEIVNEVGQVVLRNADLLENHPASYFATSEDLNNAIANGTLKMDLLWTNASPTSAFDDQTINLDLSKYKLVGIKYKAEPSTSYPNNGGGFCLCPIGTCVTLFGAFLGTDGNIWTKYRNAYITSSYVQFINKQNKNIIPLEIYGVK